MICLLLELVVGLLVTPIQLDRKKKNTINSKMASIPTQWPTDESDWIKAFDSLLRKKSYEQYKLLLLDFKTSSEEQKVMVGKILFEDHLHVQYWVDYINYAMKNFSDRKLHILRLVNKAIEILDENTCKHLKEFLELHLLSAKFKK